MKKKILTHVWLILTICRPKFISVSPPGTTLLRACRPLSMASLQREQTNNSAKEKNDWRSWFEMNNQKRREEKICDM